MSGGHSVRVTARRVRWRVAAALIFAAVIPIGSAGATSLRCNGDLIQPGDSILAVLDSCGNPDYATYLLNAYGTPVGHVLYYRGEHGQRDRRLVIFEGKVTRIEVLD